MDPCRYFLSGGCKRGDDCRYPHDPLSASPTTVRQLSSWRHLAVNSNTGTPRGVRNGPEQARDTSSGNHDTKVVPNLRGTEAGLERRTRDSRSKTLCYHYARGHCRDGSECLYAHTQNAQDITPDPDPEEITDTFKRELFGTVTQFTDGAQVVKVSLPTDFSAARINGLPWDSSPASVAALLAGLGINISNECVRIARQSGAMFVSANIMVEDPALAKSLCTKLAQQNLTGNELHGLSAVQVPPRLSRSSGARRLECRKVQCSWYKPSRIAWLNFGAENVVNKTFKKFNEKSYKILGQAVRCDQPTQGTGGRRNPHSWTLVLRDLPAAVTENDIRSAISSPRDCPRHIEMGKPSYEVDGEHASATVMSLLNQIGPIEWSQANTELEGKRAKAVARFFDEVDAREAVRSLANTTLSFCKTMRLNVQLINAAKFKVQTSIFKAVQSQIRDTSEIWEAQKLSLKIYPSPGPSQKYRVLRIEGQVANDVAAAKDTMDEILNGDIVMAKGTPIWHPSLSNNGSAYQRLKQIEKEHGVVVTREKRKKQLIIHGSPQKSQVVQSAIAELVDSQASSKTNEIPLDQEKFQWACRGGFKALSSTLGNGVCTLDVVAKRISLSGSENDYQTAMKMIKRQELSKVDGVSAAEKDCPVCLTQAENPVRTTCGHCYCLECLEGLCAATGAGLTASPVQCPGDIGNCRQILTLAELQESLSSKAFEDMLESSFISHVQHRPQTFRYCPKPGCQTIYRVASMMKLTTCAQCLTITCTHCHAQHEGMTCEEHKDHATGGYKAFEKAKKELGIQDCPECKTPIEKIDGCNHMTCRGCGAHICWVCLRTFITSRPCYEHMGREHGNIGLEYLNDL